jgi:uncharacterized membrane protein YcaP (DUF421 family)
VIKAEPALLLHDGKVLASMMAKERVTEDEILAAVRERGFGELADVGAVVLETDGSLSVLGRTRSDATTLSNVAQSPATKE